MTILVKPQILRYLATFPLICYVDDKWATLKKNWDFLEQNLDKVLHPQSCRVT
jgi:hypothetical protein